MAASTQSAPSGNSGAPGLPRSATEAGPAPPPRYQPFLQKAHTIAVQPILLSPLRSPVQSHTDLLKQEGVPFWSNGQSIDASYFDMEEVRQWFWDRYGEPTKAPNPWNIVVGLNRWP